MRRRDFLTLLGGTAVAWPPAARAQALPVIGYLDPGTRNARANLAESFRNGLAELGFVEGRNVAIEYRWAEDRSDRYPALAADLVRDHVSVIAAVGSAPLALAAKAATAAIPIVFQTGRDPIGDGLVTSMNRPGGNVTGVSRLSQDVAPKTLELLREVVPNAKAVAFLANPTSSTTATKVQEMQEPARQLGLDLVVLYASTEAELETAFASLVERHAAALQVSIDPFFYGKRDQVAALAARYAVPVMTGDRDMAVAGCLMSYGASLADSYRQTGVYVGRILKGEKPADLPIMQPTKFELVINLKTAKALGLTIPLTLQYAADEVIEP
jgi:putative ABC transport system substrate-binding protein